ncbi:MULTISPECIES: hypothetical protein [Leptospira]|uniref:Uncharacterized protein n=2 Tax=Leptospira borgpetersenii TaxID=174 RepID=A0A0E3BAV9_LEPBO|nr:MULTISPECIES: hypothetical protein [Leptospira]ALO27802.1 hypothetical protein LBBP_03620 [Leptospira borgpetersenii serovar Ballum]ANH02029.1 Uncharacterized protein LB4E_2844 [Leptospira borgpetersenii str. 4E]AXX16724.1 hypothetical protein C4Q31_15365 [Leptospira borgpetersenii serovar Ceylonica]AXX16771.1 hypothetical protein C4Q31_15720 [Leptospira borgpetersenii serovar Ceylonica]KGE26132.1 hypothetical protein IQ66_01805 [Leptospira borgpetersenii serovar Ballum]
MKEKIMKIAIWAITIIIVPSCKVTVRDLQDVNSSKTSQLVSQVAVKLENPEELKKHLLGTWVFELTLNKEKVISTDSFGGLEPEKEYVANVPSGSYDLKVNLLGDYVRPFRGRVWPTLEKGDYFRKKEFIRQVDLQPNKKYIVIIKKTSEIETDMLYTILAFWHIFFYPVGYWPIQGMVVELDIKEASERNPHQR